jgi:hypothetical protein
MATQVRKDLPGNARRSIAGAALAARQAVGAISEGGPLSQRTIMTAIPPIL